jgi:hypothetical protein
VFVDLSAPMAEQRHMCTSQSVVNGKSIGFMKVDFPPKNVKSF